MAKGKHSGINGARPGTANIPTPASRPSVPPITPPAVTPAAVPSGAFVVFSVPMSVGSEVAHRVPSTRGARRPCAGKVERRRSVVGNQNGEHLNGDQFFQNRFRCETRAPLVDEHS